MTSNQIRQAFLDFFIGKDHEIVPSSPVVPHDDPTLLFTNAGMNQFKDVFLGSGSRSYVRAADTQKCIRAGGKHNDLDDVGQDTYHHTFFEMLGNWSFGDYFKKEAIAWAWELLTGVWGIEKDRLYATYFEGDAADGLEPDAEAAELWREETDIDPSHVVPGDKKDNFWEMGDTGPCGPCSEIHIDLTPDKSGGPLVNRGDPRVMEIWNLVFIQFNRDAGGNLTPLPAKHVDTGMGFERICAVLQKKSSNYDTDVFTPIFKAIKRVTGAPDYKATLPSEPRASARADVPDANVSRPPDAAQTKQQMIDVTYRVIADHVRCLTFALTDGAVPSNEGRGYVLRRILRRAVRYGWQYLDMHEPFLSKLVPDVAEAMGDVFPELREARGGRNIEHVTELIRDEEESFGRTLERGIMLFNEAYRNAISRVRVPRIVPYGSPSLNADEETDRAIAAWEAGKEFARVGHPTISGEDAFRLHDTFGFPIDLTVLMAQEKRLIVDAEGYESLMEEARERARQNKLVDSISDILEIPKEHLTKETDDSPKYRHEPIEAEYFFHTGIRDVWISLGLCGMVFDRSCFYAEQGGQVGDSGVIEFRSGPRLEVKNTLRSGNVVVHLVDPVPLQYSGEAVKYGERGVLIVDKYRRCAIEQNHTATHLLNWALRDVLGDTVDQKGSLVDPEKTRFDFSHNKPVTDEQLARIKELVGRQIEQDLKVYAATREEDFVDQQAARKINTLRAVFGEKYPDRVRVVSIGMPIDKLLAEPDNPEWMNYSVEFCGGTHVANTGEIEAFCLISEEGVAKGVRRVVGVSGAAAKKAIADGEALLSEARELAATIDPKSSGPRPRGPTKADGHRSAEKTSGEDAGRYIEFADVVADFQKRFADVQIPILVRREIQSILTDVQKSLRVMEKEQAAQSGGAVMDAVAKLLASAPTVGGVTVVVGEAPAAPPDALRSAIDWVRNKTESSAVLLAMADEGKVTLVVGMSKDAVKRGLKAGDLIKQIAPIVGGRGGGRPDMAQGGGTDPSKISDAISAARDWITERLG